MKYIRIYSILLLVVSTAGTGNAQSKTTRTAKPNIIFILADDLGYETLQCNGSTSYQTPNLDKLAAKGVRFTNCFSTPLCTPSRVTLMTGKYNFRNYIKFNEIDPESYTFGNAMKAAGYATFIGGKWQLQLDERKDLPGKLGFDQFYLWQLFKGDFFGRYKDPVISDNGLIMQDTKGKYGPDIFSDKLLDFIKANRDKPFFAYYPMVLTHEPFQPTPDRPDFKTYDAGSVNDTSNFRHMVHYMDRDVGKIVDRIEEMGLAENTLIIFTGDNGTKPNIVSMMGKVAVRGGKGFTTVPGTHVPMIAYWKGKTPVGKVFDDLVDFTDFLPTISEAASLILPKKLGIIDGTSFYPQLVGKAGKKRDWVYCYYTQTGEVEKAQRYASDKTWKVYATGKFYNMIKDPTEQDAIDISKLSPAIKQRYTYLKAVVDNMISQERTVGTSK